MQTAVTAGTSPPPTQTASGPLSADDLAQLRRAAEAHRRIRRAGAVALGSGTTTLLIGLVSAIVTAFSPDFMSAVVSGGLLLAGAVELIGRRRLLRAQTAAVRVLMFNQLGLLGGIVLYSVIQLATFSPEALRNEALGPEARAQLAAAPDVARLIDHDVVQWGTTIHYATYCVILVVSLGFQGGLALYYATRRRQIELFRNSAPHWARDLVSRVAA